MSQYPPSPYSVPYQYPVGYAYDPYGQYLGPARRAGLLMIILGALFAVYAACNGIAFFALPADQIMRNNQVFAKDAPQLDADTMKVLGVIFSTLVLVIGVAMIVLGVLVRRNNSAAIVTGLIIVGMVAAVTGLFTVICALAGIIAPPLFLAACGMCIPLALLVLQIA